MKKIVLSTLTAFLLVCSASGQSQKAKEKLQDFFIVIPFGSDLEVIKLQLSEDPEFKLYEDHNRDSKKSIVGTFIKNKNLNPKASANRLVILMSPSGSKKKKNISIKWSIDYSHDDLAIAILDFEKVKSDFKPYFTDYRDEEETGPHREQIQSTILKSELLELTIRLIKYNSYIHTLSIEYRDVWKIKPADILKVKY